MSIDFFTFHWFFIDFFTFRFPLKHEELQRDVTPPFVPSMSKAARLRSRRRFVAKMHKVCCTKNGWIFYLFTLELMGRILHVTDAVCVERLNDAAELG